MPELSADPQLLLVSLNGEGKYRSWRRKEVALLTNSVMSLIIYGTLCEVICLYSNVLRICRQLSGLRQ